MKFGVIYDADIYGTRFEHQSVKIAHFHPRELGQRGVWTQTETSRSSWLDEGVIAHGKWCALLTKEQFKEFLSYFGFDYHSLCDTAGALGMPGNSPWYGCAPAWSIDAGSESARLNAYFTPWPDCAPPKDEAAQERVWKRIKHAIRYLF